MCVGTDVLVFYLDISSTLERSQFLGSAQTLLSGTKLLSSPERGRGLDFFLIAGWVSLISLFVAFREMFPPAEALGTRCYVGVTNWYAGKSEKNRWEN